MAAHPSIFAWRIPWIEETGWLQSLRRKKMDLPGWLTLSHFFFFSSVIRICTKPGLSRWLSGKESICQCRRQVDKNSIPGLERSPGKAMATYFSILALKIPWTEEPGGLQSMGVTKRRDYTPRGTHTVQHSMPCKGTYFVLIGQLFIFLLKFSLLRLGGWSLIILQSVFMTIKMGCDQVLNYDPEHSQSQSFGLFKVLHLEKQ